jgi:NADPH-dependent 2,4-dienoyl-CoA reductase/sulfur reductase-like enzyme
MAQSYTYIIIGGGLAGASAVDGIREIDRIGSILMLAEETNLPYHRPPLTKELWTGKKTVHTIKVHPQEYYNQKGVTLLLGSAAVSLDPAKKQVTDNQGRVYSFEKMLLATGGKPRKLSIPGGDLKGINYYRTLDDYHFLREQVQGRTSVLIIGGGFIGSELAASLIVNQAKVTMVFPTPYLVSAVFPDYLGLALQKYFEERGVRILAGDKPVVIRQDRRFVTRTDQGREIESDLVVIGIGIKPATELAEQAGLDVKNGIVVNELLQTSHPDIFAAGDNCFFPSPVLEKMMRVEHWDNALTQGKWAGGNMAGRRLNYDYQPYFFSDLFDFGYEATGEITSESETLADWQEENRKGTLYYLRNKHLRGVMTCGIYGKMDAARELIRKGETVTVQKLQGAIR